jgi:hypothetical protein
MSKNSLLEETFSVIAGVLFFLLIGPATFLILACGLASAFIGDCNGSSSSNVTPDQLSAWQKEQEQKSAEISQRLDQAEKDEDGFLTARGWEQYYGSPPSALNLANTKREKQERKEYPQLKLDVEWARNTNLEREFPNDKELVLQCNEAIREHSINDYRYCDNWHECAKSCQMLHKRGK